MSTNFDQLLHPYSTESGSLLLAIFNIFSLWRLTGQQQMTLLGLSNEKTLYNWKNQPEKAKLTRDCLERASYILGIYRALHILFPDEAQGDQWIHAPNDNPLFDCSTPVDKMLGGLVVDLAVVREHLDSQLS